MAGLRRILNLVDQVSPVNYGIWHAAVASSAFLYKDFRIESWLIAPASDHEPDPEKFPQLNQIRITDTRMTTAQEVFAGFDPKETVVVSHGAWQYPTRWGSWAKKMGFPWVYTPHGMLEPWSLSQKRFKKKIYYRFFEKPMAARASLVRAVGAPECDNLRKEFSQVVHIPNGVYPADILSEPKPEAPVVFLYLARLHHKKGLMPLAKAWNNSKPGKSPGFELWIAGTDDGEQEPLVKMIRQENPDRLRFLGPRFGNEKIDLLTKSHFYVLPSQSEGFPTSVVEAMGAGLIPIISKGCNFPEAISEGLAILTGTDQNSIVESLNKAYQLSKTESERLALDCREFAKEKYLWSGIARQQAETFSALLD